MSNTSATSGGQFNALFKVKETTLHNSLKNNQLSKPLMKELNLLQSRFKHRNILNESLLATPNLNRSYRFIFRWRANKYADIMQISHLREYNGLVVGSNHGVPDIIPGQKVYVSKLP